MNIDLIEIVKNGTVQVREIVEIENSTTWEFKRHTIVPGDDYSQEDQRVQAICAVVHTPEVISDYQAKLSA
jgi:hypothetical protein